MWFWQRWRAEYTQAEKHFTNYATEWIAGAMLSLDEARDEVQVILTQTNYFDEAVVATTPPDFEHFSELGPSLRDLLTQYDTIEGPGYFKIGRSLLKSVSWDKCVLEIGGEEGVPAYIIKGEEPIYMDDEIDPDDRDPSFQSIYHWIVINYRCQEHLDQMKTWT